VDEVHLINTEDRQAHVLVSEDQLSLAIGKEGQNVRLAARLTGWKIDIKDSAKYDYAAELETHGNQAFEQEEYEEEEYDAELELEDEAPEAVAEGEDA
jgi:transcription termination/antitermination protein NusA